MADLTGALQAAAGTAASAGGAADPNFNQTTLLLHGDGTNGAQNNTFLDSSTNNFTITRNGNTTQGSFSPFSVDEGQWSNYFDGSGDYLTAPNNSATDLGSGDFTVEAWINTTTTAQAAGIIQKYFGPGAYDGWSFRLDANNPTTGKLELYVANGSTEINITGTSIINDGAWHHVAAVRTGTTLSLFVDGVREATTTNSYNISSTSSVYIGQHYNGAFPYKGYISNIRVIKGSGPYDATSTTLTVPTAPLTNITNTSLLTCQSNRFVDNSTNNFAITVNGNPSVQPFSPFAPSAAYSPSVNGGSGYFDGTTDYLSLATNAPFSFGTNDFTIEWWQNTTDTEYGVIHTGSGGWGIVIAGGTLYFQSVIDATNLLSASLSSYAKDQWTHFALVRNSGTLYLYINGVQITSAAYSTNISLTPTTSYIGYYVSASRYLLGWFAGMRVVNGTAVYTSAFTPPTAPPTAIANTSLLLNFTNAGIFDNTGKNNLETVGNAQIDTTTKKYGTGSMEFDGTGDYLDFRSSSISLTGAFTAECWVYNSGVNSPQILCYGEATTYNHQIIRINGGYLYTTGYGATITGTEAVPSNEWVHLAVTRDSGGTIRLFTNGILNGSSTPSVTTAYAGMIGAVLVSGTAYDLLTGFIDDLRITKGVARYTANFTPPTKEFPNL